MVTKLEEFQAIDTVGLNLAKIHMVTKPFFLLSIIQLGLNLAKIHMVTKLTSFDTSLFALS